MSSDQWPKCIYCHKPIMLLDGLPYETVIPKHFQGTAEGFAMQGKLTRHYCSEYHEAKEAEKDPPLWSVLFQRNLKSTRKD